jgi:hypothetical protein
MTTAPAPPEVRCSAGQANTPCLFKKNGACFLRQKNCTDLPCTESTPVPIDCDRYAAATEADGCAVWSRCFGQYKEGCIVGAPTGKLGLAIPPACARLLLESKSCGQVTSSWEKPPCR